MKDRKASFLEFTCEKLSHRVGCWNDEYGNASHAMLEFLYSPWRSYRGFLLELFAGRAELTYKD